MLAAVGGVWGGWQLLLNFLFSVSIPSLKYTCHFSSHLRVTDEGCALFQRERWNAADLMRQNMWSVQFSSATFCCAAHGFQHQKSEKPLDADLKHLTALAAQQQCTVERISLIISDLASWITAGFVSHGRCGDFSGFSRPVRIKWKSRDVVAPRACVEYDSQILPHRGDNRI